MTKKHRKRHDRKVVSILLHELANTLMALPWGDVHRFDITCLPGMPKPGDESPYVQVVSRVDVRNALDALDLQKGVCSDD